MRFRRFGIRAAGIPGVGALRAAAAVGTGGVRRAGTGRQPARALGAAVAAVVERIEPRLLLSNSGAVTFPALTAKGPAGLLVYGGSTSAGIGAAGETDSFTIDLAPGQALTAVADPASGLWPALEVRDPAGIVVSAAAAAGAGRDVVAQSVPVAAGGTYTVTVAGAYGSTGTYALDLTLNAAAEAEGHDGAGNDSLATAQDLDPAFVGLGGAGGGSTGTPARAAVLGRLPVAAGNPLFYDDFESGTLGPAWAPYSSTSRGHVRVSQLTYSADPGRYVLYLNHDATPAGGFNINEAVFSVNLAGVTAPVLSFRHNAYGDDYSGMVPTFTGHVAGDGVSVSNDGVNWRAVWSPPVEVYGSSSGTYAVDLATAAAGMTLGPDLRVKFQQATNSAVNTVGRGFDNVAVTVAGTPDDYYRFTLAAGETATLAVAKLGTVGGETLSLYDAAGRLLAKGAAGAANADLMIPDFVAPAGGTYYAAVSGATGATYELAVLRDAGFDAEGNDTVAAARSLQAAPPGGRLTVAGRADAGNPDIYQITLPAGGTLVAATATPGDGPGRPGNAADPMLRVLDAAGLPVAVDDNSAPDGRNARVTYATAAGGTFYVEVSAATAAGGGDYVLSLDGAAPASPAFAVAATNPAGGSAFYTATPGTVDVTFNDLVFAPSLKASALTVDGAPATAVTLTTGNMARYTVPVYTAVGPHVFALAAGAATDVQGVPAQGFGGTVAVDRSPPAVAASSVAAGAVLPDGPLTFVVTFTEPVRVSNITTQDFSLVWFGSFGTVAPSSFGFDPTGTVLTATYPSLKEGSYAMRLVCGDYGFEDLAGNDLPANLSGSSYYQIPFTVDATAPKFPAPFVAQNPRGSLIYSQTATGTVGVAGDADPFAVTFDAGQTVAAVVSGAGGSLRPAVELVDAAGATLASATAPAAGGEAVLPATALPTSGTYTLRVTGADGTTGSYSVQAVLNAAVAAEDHGGAADDTPAAAQNLDAAFIPLGGGGRAAVVGKFPFGTTVTSDYYAFTAAAGEALWVAVAKQGTTGGETVALTDAAGAVLAAGAAGATNYDSAAMNFVAPAGGTYYVRVSGNNGAAYNLVVARSAALDVEPNDAPAAAQPLGPAGVAVGALAAGNDDYYSFPAAAGDTLVLTTTTPGGDAGEFVNTLNPKVELYDPAGAALAADDDGAVDGRNARLVYAVPAAGFYRVRVTAGAGGAGVAAGEYTLAVSGNSPQPIPATPDLLDVTDSGASAADNVTAFNNASPDRALTFAVRDTVPGAVVTLYVGDHPVAAATATGATTVVSTDGATVLPDGTYPVIARQALAGGPESVASLPLMVTIDTAAPAAPVAPDLTAASDSGSSATDNITNRAPVVAVAGAPFSRVYRDGVKVSGDYQAGTSFTSAALPGGTYAFTATAVDAAGNESPPGAALAVTVDTVAPTITGLTAPAVVETGGTTGTFQITFADNMAVDVSTVFSNLITVGFPGTLAFYGFPISVDVNANGTPRTVTYQFTPPGGTWDSSDAGTYTVSFQSPPAKDVAGNAPAGGVAGTFSQSLTIPLGVPDLDATADSGISDSDNITKVNGKDRALAFSIPGTVAGGSVTLYADGKALGTVSGQNRTTVISLGGSWYPVLADKTYTLTARQRLPSGAETPDSLPLVLTVDTTAPAAPPAPDLRAGDDSGVSDTDNLTNVSIPAFDVTAAPYYQFYVNGSLANGIYLTNPVYNAPLVYDGIYDCAVATVDAAGNVSPLGPSLAVTVDTLPGSVSAASNLDPAFGAGGIALAPASTGYRDIEVEAVAVQPDGKIVAAGRSHAGQYDDFAVVRFLQDGSPDPSFGTRGKAVVSAGDNDYARAVAIQADGKIVAAGHSDSHGTMVRFNPDGTLDATFGTGGKLDSPGGLYDIYALATLPDGKLLAAGDSRVIRLNPNGSLDPSFGSGGKVFVDFGLGQKELYALAVLPDGRFYVGGRAYAKTTGIVARYNPTGTPDTFFGSGGLFVPPAGMVDYGVYSLAVPSSGGVMAAGQGGVASLIRIGDRSLDREFGTGGGVNDPPNSQLGVHSVVVRPDGRILTTYQVYLDPAGNQSGYYRVAQYQSDGTPDTTFGIGGVAETTLGGSAYVANNVALQPDGKLVIGSSAQAGGYAFAVTRFGGTALAAPALLPADDAGPSQTDGVTNVATPTFRVSRPDPYFRLYRNGVLIGPAYAAGDSITLPPQPDGTWTYTAVSVDAAGNVTAAGPGTVVTIDTAGPTAVVGAVGPGPRARPVDAMTITFSEPVAGFDLADLVLSRDGGPNLLTGAQTLTTADHVHWTLGNLAPLTGRVGTYALALAAGLGVSDAAGNGLAAAAAGGFVVQPAALPPGVVPSPGAAVTFADGVLTVLTGTVTLTGDFSGDGLSVVVGGADADLVFGPG